MCTREEGEDGMIASVVEEEDAVVIEVAPIGVDLRRGVWYHQGDCGKRWWKVSCGEESV